VGTAEMGEYKDDGHGEDDLDDFDFNSHGVKSPIVKDFSKSKRFMEGGDRSNLTGSLLKPSDQSVSIKHKTKGFRSKRAEEKYKLSHMIFDGPVRVRIMDVDKFDLNELHHYFMYTLVRRFPSEKCLKVATRIALFRDKNTQHSFECMSRDIEEMFGPIHGPELTALFSRCYMTLPIPFMLDYIRRFGRFSRQYLAKEVDNTIKPRLFDFVRYPGGVKPLPGIVTRPFALKSFAQLLPPCSAKKYIFQHLLARTGDEKVLSQLREKDAEITRLLRDAGRIDPQASLDTRVGEKLVESHGRRRRNDRPRIEEIQADVHALQPTNPQDIIAALEAEVGRVVDDSIFDLQFTQVQPFKSPLVGEECTDLELARDADESSGIRTTIPAEFDERPDEPSWFSARRKRQEFFRYNKRAYNLGEEGWKQIEDPRGEVPDYERSKAFRDKKKNIEKHYSRMRRMRSRQLSVIKIVRKQLVNDS